MCIYFIWMWRQDQAADLIRAQIAAVRARRSETLEKVLAHSSTEADRFHSIWRRTVVPGEYIDYNEVVSTYRDFLPAISAVLVPGPRHDADAAGMAHAAAHTIGTHLGREIPVLRLLRSPHEGRDAIVPL